MRIFIIEDEKNNADRICRLIHEIDPSHEIIGIAADNCSAKAFFTKPMDVDLILSDIQLGDGLSFEALQTIEKPIPVIFTTAYDHYAVQAFKYNGIDYLLKPIDREELRIALSKVIPKQRLTFTTTDLRQLLEIAKLQNIRFRERFLIPKGSEELLIISINEVSMIKIHDGLVCLFTKKGQLHPINITLDELEKQLDPKVFMRVNRQSIVYVGDIVKISTTFLGKIRIHINSFPTEEIIVSKEKASAVKRWIGS